MSLIKSTKSLPEIAGDYIGVSVFLCSLWFSAYTLVPQFLHYKEMELIQRYHPVTHGYRTLEHRWIEPNEARALKDPVLI